jgi:hypothetical protein
MPDLSSAPTAVQRFAGWLAEHGAHVSVQSFASPTNQLLRAPTARGTVQIVADRGQWFVELAPPEAGEYFDTAVWTACLSGSDVSLELQSLDAQVEWLIAFLGADASSRCSIECLREARQRRAYRRMGLL